MVKLNDKCLCCVTVAMLLRIPQESSSEIWVKHFSQLLSYEWKPAQTWTMARLLCTKIVRVPCPRFLPLFIERWRLFYFYWQASEKQQLISYLGYIQHAPSEVYLDLETGDMNVNDEIKKNCWAFKPAMSERDLTPWTDNLVFLKGTSTPIKESL